MKSRILYILSLLICYGANAQQEFQFANSVNNPFILNPAAGGLSDNFQLETNSRLQWLGYEGGPRTFMLNGSGRLFAKSGSQDFNRDDKFFFENPIVKTHQYKHILGGKVWYDAIGPFAKTAIHGSYAYHLPINSNFMIGAGIGLGYSNFGVKSDRINLYQQDDANYTQFLGNASNVNLFDAQFGLVVYTENLFIGYSTAQTFRNKFKPEQVVTNSFFNTHHFVTLKYKFQGKESDFGVEPIVIARMVKNSPFAVDFGAKLYYKNATWFGVQYRTSNNLVFQIGSNMLKHFYLAYAFEVGVGKIRTQSNGTHEFTLGYYFGKNRNLSKEIKEK